ncbi:MAG: hemin receptor [Betaproteobacteria bacterium]|nr:hemin receptor [Betaproteobacteria bacterium]
MSPEDAELVERTWKGILPIRDTFAELFYRKLFELDPGLRPLFKGDLKEQGRNLVAMMSIAVRHLRKPEAIATALRELGRRHASYGVRDEHYELVRTALILSLDLSLGEEFGPQARGAWEAAYDALSGAMRGVAAPAHAGA